MYNFMVYSGSSADWVCCLISFMMLSARSIFATEEFPLFKDFSGLFIVDWLASRIIPCSLTLVWSITDSILLLIIPLQSSMKA